MNNNIEKKKRQKELTEKLNAASRAYYQEAREILSNYEYDALYDELAALEKETGVRVPKALKDLDKKEIRHKGVIEISQMPEAVEESVK